MTCESIRYYGTCDIGSRVLVYGTNQNLYLFKKVDQLFVHYFCVIEITRSHWITIPSEISDTPTDLKDS